MDNIIVLNFAEAPRPVFKEHRTEQFTKFGADNLYPLYLLRLYDQSAKHNAIIKGKVNYITGNGWEVKKTDPIIESFIARANPYETLAEVTAKASTDLEIFGGCYLQVNWSKKGGFIAEVYHLDYTKWRTNKDNTQFWFKNDWTASGEKAIPYLGFDPAVRQGKQILYIREYRPGLSAYALPGYMGALNNIEADIEVSRHTLGNAQSGFSGSKMISFTNGEPSDEKKKSKIESNLKDKFTGSGGSKLVIEWAKSKDQTAIVQDLGASDLTKEDFTSVNNLIQQEIFAGHMITSPALFGIKTEGQLGATSELREAYEIFKNTYVNDKQRFLESVFNSLAKLKGGREEMAIKPVEPIVYDVLSSEFISILPKEFIYEKLGIDITKYPPVPLPGSAPAAEGMESQVNDNIKSLSAKEHQQLMRIIRQYSKQQITEAVARTLIKTGLGLGDEDINSLLGIEEDAKEQQFSDELMISLFEACGEPAVDYAIIKRRKVDFKTDADMAADEEQFSVLQLSFAEKQFSQLQTNILDLIKKDDKITPEVLAEVLNESLDLIKEALKGLEDAGALKISSQGETITRELTEPIKELSDKKATTQFQVKYGYGGPEDSKNRPFCAKMMQLGRIYSRKEIETISAKLGYSVFDRRGGFYTNPNTGETTPYCRHFWESQIVTKKQDVK